MRELNSEIKNFDLALEKLLLLRKNKVQSNSVSVSGIIKDVKKNGDKAVLKYEKKFNQNNVIVPTAQSITKSIASLDKKVKKAIDLAYSRIHKFHSLQKFKNISYTDSLQNKLEYKYLPIDSVAIYVPGSTASYPSSVLMNAIPALVAGVKRIVMINPGFKGVQNPAVLYAARKCKIKEIYSIGGPSAIAAVAYGTKKIKKVDKIVGPGNSYVAAAKKEVFGDVGIEGMTAGPSEVTIVCDKFSNAEWVASDLIGQAEHDNLAQCILISKDKNLLNKVKLEITKQLKEIPRISIAKKSLVNNGILLYIKSDQKIIEVVNKIAPEHLELNVKNYKQLVSKIKNSGSICLGKYAVMAMTDYNVGSNHVLPTNGSAKYSSGISVNEFYKRISYINLSKKGIETLGPSVITLAINELKRNNLPYLVLITDPTAGGITASYAMLGDIHIAEPGALIAFAGARVIQGTVKEELPEGFQRSEYVEKTGFVDLIVERKDLTDKIGNLLSILLKQNSAVSSELNETTKDSQSLTKAAS